MSVKKIAARVRKSSAPAPSPTITVFADKFVTGMTRDTRTKSVSLAEALTREWPTDAHFTAYEPRTAPLRDSDERAAVRLLHEAKDEEHPAVYDVLDMLDVPCVRLVAMVGDIDDPGKVGGAARAEWRAEHVPGLEASGLAYYETRGGFRVLALTDFEIRTPADAAEWTRAYLGWCLYLETTHGLVLDRACKDWTRCYRLPNVIRDGRPQRADVRGALPTWDPAQWIDLGTAAPTPRVEALGVVDDAAMARAHALAERLPPSVEGHGGDAALFAAANELATILGEDADALERVLADVFNPRCHPPWDAAKIRREATRAAERQADPMARWARRRNERAANDPGPSDSERSALILQSRRDAEHVLLWESWDRGHQPVALGALRLRIAELGLPIMLKPTEGGKMPSAAALVENYGRTFGQVAYDFACRASRHEPEHDRVVVGYPVRPIEGARDADADAWLRALAGEQYPRLEQWIASCSQRHIGRLAAALVILGPADLGKSLFADSVAGLWDVAEPASAQLLIDRFNGDLTRCPIVFDDEARLFGSRHLSTKDFRELIQSVERSIERKGRERFMLRGAHRLIVAGNAHSDIRFTDVGGPEVVQAVGDRLCVIDAAARADACRSALARLRLPDGYMCDRERIVRHLAWLVDRVELPRERFVGGGAGEETVLAGHVRNHPDMWTGFKQWLDVRDGNTNHPWSVHGGELMADPAGLFPSNVPGGVPREAVHAALAPFKLGERRPRLASEARPRLWALDAGAVATAIGLDDDAVQCLLDRLEASRVTDQARVVRGRFGPIGPRAVPPMVQPK